jgi:hypothetical protein
MMLSQVQRYQAYARECLELAERATRSDVRQGLIELSHVWMEAALTRGKGQIRRPPIHEGIVDR